MIPQNDHLVLVPDFQTVVLDTNVLLDLFVFHDPRWQALYAALETGRVRAATREDCDREWQVVLNYGFKNDPDLPRALRLMKGRGFELEPMSTSYFLSRDTIAPSLGSDMAPWREKLFAQMHLNASGAANFLNLPSNSVVELGSKIEI